MARALLFVSCVLASTNGADASTTIFISSHGLSCFEGPTRQAEAALALKKSAPYGSLFVDSFGQPGETCVAHGFTIHGGADACTPDVNTFFKDKDDPAKFQAAQQAALDGYREEYSLTARAVSLMSNCTCQWGSPSLTAAGDQCAELDDVTACWVHLDPWQNNKLMMCDEGKYVYAMRVLSVLKGSPQLAMHFNDQIRATSCSSLGFTEIFNKPDHCYPAMRIWTRTDIGTDPGVQESVQVEHNLTTGGFFTFAKDQGFGDVSVLNNSLGCNCFVNSSVGQQLKGTCDAQEDHSPVRDWWPGDRPSQLTLV